MERPKYVPRVLPSVEQKKSSDEARARMTENLRIAKAMRTGSLTLKEYSLLHKTLRQSYTKQFGRPKTPGELLAKTKAFRRTKTRRKIATESKRRNR